MDASVHRSPCSHGYKCLVIRKYGEFPAIEKMRKKINGSIHCKNESVYSTPLCPNTHTVYGLVCVLGQFSVQYTLSFLQCIQQEPLAL